MPWKVVNELKRVLVAPLGRLRFLTAGVKWSPGLSLYGVPIIQRHRRSSISLGHGASLRSSVRSNPLGPARPVILSTRSTDARIQIGDNFAMTGGTIVAENSVTIGHRVTIGADCVITDTDFHPLDPAARSEQPTLGEHAPVTLGDDVFLGMRSVVLKGVTIGSGTVVGACSVVSSDLPGGVVAAGNPARVLRAI